MAKDKVQIIQVNTDPAKKSLKDLRKELLDLKNEMANLEEGSDAFLEAATKAGELKHQIDEINESVKGASSDFGDMVGNISNVAAGLVGAFSAVQGGLQAMGLESKAIEDSIKQMQGLMAVVQGLSTMDTAIKSLNKLRNAITSTTGAAKLLKAALEPKVFLAISAAIALVTVAFNKMRAKQEEAARAQEEYNKKIAEEKRIRIDAERAKYLKDLDRELRIKLAIAEVKYEGDELKIKKEQLKELRTELALLNVEYEFYKNGNYAVGEDPLVETQKRAEALKKILAEIERLNDDIAVLEAVAAERAKHPKKSSTTSTTEEKTDLGLVEFTDEDLQKGLERVRQYYEEVYDIQLEQNKRKKQTEAEALSAEIEIEKNRLLIYAEGTLEYEKQLTKIFELEEQYAELTNTNTEKVKSKLELIEELGNSMFDTLKSSLDMFGESSLGLTGNWNAALEDFQSVFKQTMEIVKTEGKSTWTAYGNVAASALNGIGTLLNALSNEQDASNEEGFEQMKKLQIAATTINMLSGIVSAWTSAMNPANSWMTVWGQIAMGTAMSAMIAAVGGMQIAKIKSQTRESANPNSNINARAVNSTIMPPVQYSSAVQGAQTQGAIQSQKVYVTETDIVDTIHRVDVQQAENTY